MAKEPKSAETSDDPQKVDFDYDPELKKQLDASGSYQPTKRADAEEHMKQYIPPGPHPMGADGMGGAAGGVAPKVAPKPTEPAAGSGPVSSSKK